jgi:hypothetical protein
MQLRNKVPSQRVAVELCFGITGHQTNAVDQPTSHPDRECTAAKAERNDPVSVLVVAAQEFITVEDVTLDADAKSKAQNVDET